MKHRDNPTVTYWDALRKGIGRSFIVFLALCILAIYSGLRGDRGHAALYVAGSLGWLGYILFVSLPSVYYRKLIKAGDWSQWNEVLSLVATLQLIGRIQLGQSAGNGIDPESSQSWLGWVGWMRPWPNIANARAVQIARLGCINCLWLRCTPPPGSADKAIEYNLASIAAKPTSTAWADLANRYARYKSDAVKARSAMAEAEKSPLSDVAKPFCIRCQGIIAYLEGNYGAAKRDLQIAIELVEKAKGRPARTRHLSVARAYLCCVLAKQGDLAGATKCLALAKNYLVATKEDELLAQCRQLCGEK